MNEQGDPQNSPRIEQALTRMYTAPNPDPAFVARLEEQLLLRAKPPLGSQMVREPHLRRFWQNLLQAMRRPRLVTTTVALLLILAGTVMIYPQAHAFAQDSVDYLLAYFGFSRASRIPPIIKTPLPVPPETTRIPEPTRQPAIQTLPLTREQAQAQAGFSVKEPTWLPAGYQHQDGFVILAGEMGKRVMWRAFPVKPVGCEYDIHLEQSPVPLKLGFEEGLPIGDHPMAAVIVNQSPGLWIGQAALAVCDFPAADGTITTVMTGTGDLLIWDSDGIRYRLEATSSLGLEEMLKMAESLRGDDRVITPAPPNPAFVTALRALKSTRPVLGEVSGQRFHGKLIITFEGNSYAGWSAYEASEDIQPAQVQADLFVPTVAALRDSSIPTQRLSGELDTFSERYVVVEVWDSRVNIGATGAEAELRELAVKMWAEYFGRIR